MSPARLPIPPSGLVCKPGAKIMENSFAQNIWTYIYTFSFSDVGFDDFMIDEVRFTIYDLRAPSSQGSDGTLNTEYKAIGT